MSNELTTGDIVRDYPALAARTAGTWERNWEELLNRMIGVGQELLELAGASAGDDEFRDGDVLWYAARAATLCDLDWAALCAKAKHDVEYYSTDYGNLENIMSAANSILDHVKKAHRKTRGVGYGPLGNMFSAIDKESLHYQLATAMTIVLLWSVCWQGRQLTLEDLLTANVAKLAARHPDGFNADYASKEGK